MKTRTKIIKQSEKKTNPYLVETIFAAKKNENWKRIAEILSGPRKKNMNLNLGEIGNKIGEEKNIIIPGKVLSQGEIGKKAKIIAFNFSEKAREKLSKAGCEILNILEEIKKNPEAKGVKILE
jgi:large subunit ribosomal protein L18e